MGGTSGSGPPAARPGQASQPPGASAGAPGDDLAALRAAFEELRAQLLRLAGVPTQPDHAPLIVDRDGRIAYATQWLTTLFGVPAVAFEGVRFDDAVAWLGLRALDTSPDGSVSTYALTRPDGSQQLLRLRVAPLRGADGTVLGTLHHFQDVTATLAHARELAEKNRQLDEARAHLARAQHLKALGGLAAEVAHEFGNLLQAIGLQSAALRRQQGLPENVTRAMVSIKQAVDMGQALTRRLLIFARDDPDRQREALDMSRVLRELVQLLEPRINKKLGNPVRIELDLPELPAVSGDQTKLTEAFLNLFLNALEAMADGGILRVTASERSGEIRIAVGDTGTGMNRDTAQRAFDPFFTTKPGSTGLGLSTVYGVVRDHGGSVFLESEPDAGTTVFVSLPSNTPPVVAVPAAPERPAAVTERVLVVDDHPTVRSATVELLSANGYAVESAGTAAEAIQAVTDRLFTVVVTDIGLPDRPGWEVARAAKQRSASTIVILVSGWGSHFRAEEARARGVDLVFEKPVDPDLLLAAIERELRAAAQARPTCA